MCEEIYAYLLILMVRQALVFKRGLFRQPPAAILSAYYVILFIQVALKFLTWYHQNILHAIALNFDICRNTNAATRL